MIFSTSSSSKTRLVWALLTLLTLPNCALWKGQPAEPLAFGSLISDKTGPLAARSTSIRWTASATGGVGGLNYEFRTLRGKAETIEQAGPSSTWDWNPSVDGAFRVKVAITDSTGAVVESGWSPKYAILPAAKHGDLIAVLPVDNLTGTSAPLGAVEAVLRSHLDRRGFRIVDDQTLAKVMHRYRIRNTGSLNSRIFAALKEETGAAGVLLTSLEVFYDDQFPRISLLSRLVVGGDRPEIAWMDGVGLAGEGHPGLLARGRIGEIDGLLEIATRCLVDSLAISFFEPEVPDPSNTRNELNECDSRGDVVYSPPEANGKRKFHPRMSFGSPIADLDRRYSMAVIPFLNLSQRKNAGRILELHFVNQLFRNDSLSIVEPGLVREELLEHRVVMAAGPSLENAEVLSNDESLGVDLVLSGVVFDYQDAFGIPKVDFSVTMIEKESRRVVWSSRSHGTGEDGVLFFDLGMVHTAHQLASEMARGTSEALSQ
jgi:TolB-like protein